MSYDDYNLQMKFINGFLSLNYELLAVSKIAKYLIELKRNNLSEIQKLCYMLNTLSELVLNKILIFLDWQYEYTRKYTKKRTNNENHIYEIPHVIFVYYKHLDRSEDILSFNKAYPNGIFTHKFKHELKEIKTLEDLDKMLENQRNFQKDYYMRFTIKGTRIWKCIDKYTLEKFLEYSNFFTPKFYIDFCFFEGLKNVFKSNEIGILKYIVEKWNVYIDNLHQILAFTRWVIFSNIYIKNNDLRNIFNDFKKNKNILIKEYIKNKNIDELDKIKTY